MATKTKFALKGKGKDTYLELVLQFPLASIKSDEHLETAQEVMDRLLAKSALDDGAAMYLDALSDLVPIVGSLLLTDLHQAVRRSSFAGKDRSTIPRERPPCGRSQSGLLRDSARFFRSRVVALAILVRHA